MEGNKKRSTYSIDEEIRNNFKIETTINGVDMSETIEGFMSNYVIASRKLRKERENKDV